MRVKCPEADRDGITWSFLCCAKGLEHVALERVMTLCPLRINAPGEWGIDCGRAEA